MGFFGPDRVWSTDARKKRAMGEYDEIQERTGDQAERATSGYLDRAEAFDPSEAVSTYGEGFMDEATEQLGNSFSELQGQSVGRGRTNTGFFQKDGQRMFQDFNRRVSNAIAMQSLNAAGMDLQNIQGLGAFGTDMAGQQVELLAGAMDRSTAEDNARTSPAEMITSLAGSAAGAMGGSAGGGLFSAVSGAFSGQGGRDKRAGERRRRMNER